MELDDEISQLQGHRDRLLAELANVRAKLREKLSEKASLKRNALERAHAERTEATKNKALEAARMRADGDSFEKIARRLGGISGPTAKKLARRGYLILRKQEIDAEEG